MISEEPNFWLFKKHIKHIQILDMYEKDFRLTIAKKKTIELYKSTSGIDSVFPWENISPHFSFFFNYQGNNKEIRDMLMKSELGKHEKMLLETNAGEPIIEVSVKYFINHWLEFVDANNGQGSIMTTSDYSLLLEFTNDADYLLLSNFKIK